MNVSGDGMAIIADDITQSSGIELKNFRMVKSTNQQ